MTQINQYGSGSPGKAPFSSTIGGNLTNGANATYSTDTSGNIIGLVSPSGTTVLPLYAPASLSTAYQLTAADDGRVYNVTTALTVTIPAGLSPRPAVVFIPPPSGNLSIAVSGGANINGATTTLTRSRSSNPSGVVVQPYTESDGYGVSGS